jgi:hypothetical protein
MNLGLQFYITIAISLVIGLASSVVPNKSLKNLMVIASTLGVLIAIGSTVYWFLNLLVLGVIMYFYLSSETIDDTLLKTIILMSTISLLGWWRYEQKEGFYVSPLKIVSESITAKNCQDMCQSAIGCKYAQVPSGSSLSGRQTKCEHSYGFDQKHWGNVGQSGDTWINRTWQPPVILSGSSKQGWYNKVVSTTGSGAQTISISKSAANMVPKQITINAKLRDQGWGNPTWGIYLEGWGPNGRVFKEVLKAPRSSKTVSFPVYRTSCRTSWRRKWYRIWWRWWNPWTYWWQPYRSCSRYLAYYGSKNVLGDPLNNTITKEINPKNEKITSVSCYAHTRGSGHSLYASTVNWDVKGWKKK